MALVLTMNDGQWLCDLGFGSYRIRAPIRLDVLDTEIKQDLDTPARNGPEEAFDVGPIIGAVLRPCVCTTANELAQGIQCLLGEVRLRIVKLHPLPGCVRELRHAL